MPRTDVPTLTCSVCGASRETRFWPDFVPWPGDDHWDHDYSHAHETRACLGFLSMRVRALEDTPARSQEETE